MFLIAGLDGKSDVFESHEQRLCSNCNNLRTWKLIKNTNYISVFFIRTIPVKTKYFFQCPICSYGYEISEDDFRKLK